MTLPMQDLTHQRCINHKSREAVARCPECRRFFCRECITEHEDKVLCASCLRKQLTPGLKGLRPSQWIYRLGHITAGIMLLYILFYYVAQILLTIPADFHEGTFWTADWWNDH